MGNPDSSEDGPLDFSFLGNDSIPDDAQDFNFHDASAKSDNPVESASVPLALSPPSQSSQVTNSKPSPAKVSSPPEKVAPRKEAKRPTDAAGQKDNTSSADSTVPKKTFNALLGYAAAVTLLFLFLLLTGRISLSGSHQLESLPDIKPLRSDEFQLVPPTASLPSRHTLRLGESQRFGDVILTPEKVSFEPITFAHMLTGAESTGLKSPSVLKLWFKVENAASDISFSPWSVGLMCHHSQRTSEIATDENTLTNSWLMVQNASTQQETRVLNFMHPPESSFNIVDHGGDVLVTPGKSQTCFVASSDAVVGLRETAGSYRWRIQIRKGVNRKSGNGVTTLIDVNFDAKQIETETGV